MKFSAKAFILYLINIGGISRSMRYQGTPLSQPEPSEKSQRSPELVAQLKEKAEAKRQRKCAKRISDKQLDYV